MKFRIAIVIAFVFCLASAWAERPGNFRVIGPGGGGAMFNPTISPHDPNTVLVSCDMTGSYITHDGGRTWRMFNLRGVVSFFVFDPLDPKTIYAHATGLWRSTDGGERWDLVYPNPSAVKGVKMNSDHCRRTDSCRSGSIERDRSPGGRSFRLQNSLRRGWDEGESRALCFERLREDLAKKSELARCSAPTLGGPEFRGRQPYVVSREPTRDRGGQSVERCTAVPLPAQSVTFRWVLVRARKPTIYATSEQGIYVSNDAGANWRKSDLPGAGAKVRAIATSLHHPETAYVSYDHLKADGKSWMGVAKTTNSGADWKLVWKESAVGGKERERRLDHGALWTDLGRKSSNSYSSSTGRQSRICYRPWKNHADE